ncbi:hypothetical protein P4C99_17740 [Pontiellaceae bacterium B1224]|nr:hypothetical protein [Pontiellaceae bacterium B1224]
MEKEKVNVMYDENGNAVRVQMDFDLYQWLVGQVPQTEQSFAVAR